MIKDAIRKVLTEEATKTSSNAQSLREATELFERIYAQDYYKFIITEKGNAVAQEILKQK